VDRAGKFSADRTIYEYASYSAASVSPVTGDSTEFQSISSDGLGIVSSGFMSVTIWQNGAPGGKRPQALFLPGQGAPPDSLEGKNEKQKRTVQ